MSHFLETALLAQGSDASSVLLQYGALGVFALSLLFGVKVLFQREAKAFDLERQRADRLEEELRRLNESIHEKYIPVLTKATEVIAEVLQQAKQGNR